MAETKQITPKQYLNQYRKLNAEIDSICEEIQCLRNLSTRTSAGTSGMPHNPNRKTEASFVNVVEKILEKEARANEKIDRLLMLGEEIGKAIDTVQDGTLRTLLRYRYICCYSWVKISMKMDYSEDHVKGYLHGKALVEFGKIRSKVNTF